MDIWFRYRLFCVIVNNSILYVYDDVWFADICSEPISRSENAGCGPPRRRLVRVVQKVFKHNGTATSRVCSLRTLRARIKWRCPRQRFTITPWMASISYKTMVTKHELTRARAHTHADSHTFRDSRAWRLFVMFARGRE